MGMFIVFEGIEGCGKTTQIGLLESFLAQQGLAFVVSREPGGTPVSEEIRKIFLHTDHADIMPLTELLLVTAARVQHVHQVIRPALEEHKIVVCDRFFDATVAYQGYGGGLPLDYVYRSHELFLHSLTPDLTILLDCPVAVGLSRSRGRNRAAGKEKEEGRFEDMAVRFHEKVRQGYLALAAREPQRFRVIDAGQPVAAIHEKVRAVVSAALKEKGYAV